MIDLSVKMKKCTKCGEIKPTTAFYKDAGKRDGMNAYCKPCSKVSNAKWKAENKEKLKVSRAEYRAANAENIRLARAKFYAENAEKVKAANAARRAKNLEMDREARAAWRSANKNKAKATYAAWYASNRDERIAAMSAWAAANPEKLRIYSQNRRARKLENGGKLSTGITQRLFKLQRGKCACCGKPLGDKYHLDHIMPLSLGGTNADDNVQLLRAECNLSKHAKHPIEFMQERGFLL